MQGIISNEALMNSNTALSQICFFSYHHQCTGQMAESGHPVGQVVHDTNIARLGLMSGQHQMVHAHLEKRQKEFDLLVINNSVRRTN
jgi:hypothetical protein